MSNAETLDESIVLTMDRSLTADKSCHRVASALYDLIYVLLIYFSVQVKSSSSIMVQMLTGKWIAFIERFYPKRLLQFRLTFTHSYTDGGPTMQGNNQRVRSS